MRKKDKCQTFTKSLYSTREHQCDIPASAALEFEGQGIRLCAEHYLVAKAIRDRHYRQYYRIFNVGLKLWGEQDFVK